jgi:hypothetical protein
MLLQQRDRMGDIGRREILSIMPFDATAQREEMSPRGDP